MSPDEQRIAIQRHFYPEAIDERHAWYGRDDNRRFVCGGCGDEHMWGEYEKAGFKHPEGPCVGWLNCNYPQDLNAVREIEALAAQRDPDFWIKYLDPGIGILTEVCGFGDDAPVAHASAEQRTEALCKTLGLWKEAQP